jgi:serine/threonine protein kinase
MAVAEAHPSIEELTAFTLGTLDEETQVSIEAHVATCTSCQERAADAPGDNLVELVRRVGARTGRLADTFVDTAAQVQTPVLLSALAETDALMVAESDRPEVPDALPPELARHERYRVVRLVGAGGMGAVYEAEHRVMQRPVALKVIKRAYISNADALKRFRREIRNAARLSHPNIVTTYDAEDAGETHFLVMEYVAGIDLGRLVQERGPLPVDRACDYARQAALGLHHAFEKDMVHRDLKPHNLMRTPDGRVKILDFGLAHFASEAADAAGLTSTGIVLGTVDYIAPEQADNAHQADIRSDIYSLGCTLYHLLAGQPPFPTGTSLQKVMAHVNENPQPLTKLRDDLPEGLMSVLERMMAKNPRDRYQTPSEVAFALEPFTRTISVTRAPRRRIPARTTDTNRTVILKKNPRGDRWRSRLMIATAILAFFVAGLLGVGVYRIATDDGELVIRTESEDVDVVVSKGGKVVKVIDSKSGKHVTLNSGDYELALNNGKDELKISPVKLTVKRGETVLATIERVPHQNLIKNGGFEAGLESWDTWSHQSSTRFEFDRDVVREGQQSLRVTASEADDCGCKQHVRLKPQQWYRFSGWVRTRGLKLHGASRRHAPLAWGTIVIFGTHHPSEGPEWPVLARGDNQSGDTEWTRISLRFQAPDDGIAGICLCPAAFSRITGTVWFDELKLVEVDP